MAKKSMIAKAKRTPKHPVQGYHRCFVCGRPAGLHAPVRAVPDLLPERALLGELPGVTKSSW